MAWINGGPIGLGNWITDEDGRQIAVTYGKGVNPKSAEDTALITAVPDLVAALEWYANPEIYVGDGWSARPIPAIAEGGRRAREALSKAQATS